MPAARGEPQRLAARTDTGTSHTRRARRAKAVRWALGTATAAMVTFLAARHWNELRQFDLEIHPGWTTAAVLASVAATLLLVLAWRELIAGYRTRLAPAPATRIWLLSQATRYLPTGLAPVVARASLAAPHGIARASASASVVVETAALVGWAALFAAVLAPTEWPSSESAWIGAVWALRVALGLAAAVGLLTLPWTLAGAWWRRFAQLLRRVLLRRVAELIGPDAFRAERPAVWRATAAYGAAVATRLVAAALLAFALTDATAADLWLIIGATAAGIVVGMVGITPAGLGVREVVVAALLAPQLGVADATALAIAIRALEFAHEAALLPAAAAIGRRPASDTIPSPSVARDPAHDHGRL